MSAVRCTGNLPEAFQQAVGILAKRWTPLILFVLRDGPRRFSEIAGQIEFVSDRMLSERLKELEGEGLISRQVFAEVPVRVEYRLTEKGRDLDPIFMAIGRWAARWLDPALGAACFAEAGTAGRETHEPEAPAAEERHESREVATAR